MLGHRSSLHCRDVSAVALQAVPIFLLLDHHAEVEEESKEQSMAGVD